MYKAFLDVVNLPDKPLHEYPQRFTKSLNRGATMDFGQQHFQSNNGNVYDNMMLTNSAPSTYMSATSLLQGK